ncbi:MAG: endonuclease/exonuclease/phosphatase family protein [Paracoccaceae bacterium]
MSLRVATWNIEWFGNLFDAHSALKLDGDWSARYKVTRAEQGAAIAKVLQKLDADLLLIVEAPNTGKRQSTVRALNNFAAAFGLRQSAAAIGFANDTHQELAVMYDPDNLSVRHDPRGLPGDGVRAVHAPRFDSQFRLDVDVDGQPDVHIFSKPPVEMEITLANSARQLRLIGVHTKSKAPHGAANATEELAVSIANRRKQLAQCVWLRQRVEDHLRDGDDLIVLGDFNDGPGLDSYESLFGRSSVEVVLGLDSPPERQLLEPHARIRLDPRQGWSLSTSRFYSKQYKRYLNALLDYVMLSPDLAARSAAKWRIWHPFDDPECFDDDAMRLALLAASDHFPVSVDLDLP